jgi:D-alanine--poly(phosphoribitol) ligase subunit 2
MSESHLIELVIEWVKENNRRTEAIEINEDTDLFKSGAIDSFGLVDLIVYIESETGCVVKLADTDPGEFSLVRGLCRIALNGDHLG